MGAKSIILSAILIFISCAFAQEHDSWEERRAHDVILRLYLDGIYRIAEKEAEDFLTKYPNSPYKAEIALIQARAAMMLKQYDKAIKILEQFYDEAGQWQDDYLYWQAQVLVAQGAFSDAVGVLQKLVERFPDSPWAEEAIVRIAECWYRAGNLSQCINFIEDPAGIFQKLAKQRPESEWVARGQLLLAEALFKAGNLTGAEGALSALSSRPLSSTLEWQRTFLQTKLYAASSKWQEAIAQSSNLWTVATNWISSALLSEAADIQGQAFEKLGRLAEALQSYQRNLSTSSPLSWRLLTVDRLFALASDSKIKDQVIQVLTRWVEENPTDPATARILLRLAEESIAAARALEGRSAEKAVAGQLLAHLERATQYLRSFLNVFKDNPETGRAHAMLGWCYRQLGQIEDAERSYARAVSMLDSSKLRSEARLGWADCLAALGRFELALTNYLAVATNTTELIDEADELRIKAYCQTALIASRLGRVGLAMQALESLREFGRRDEEIQKAYISTIRAWIRIGEVGRAQALISEFVSRFSDSPFLAEVELLKAEAYEHGGSIDQAIEAYRSWLETYTNSVAIPLSLQARALFSLAALNLTYESITNPVELATSFVARFPRDENVPILFLLIGQYFFRKGQYHQAEEYFVRATDPRLVIRDPSVPYHARLMAARSAVAQGAIERAQSYLDSLVTNLTAVLAERKVSPELVAHALVLRGDLSLMGRSEGQADQLSSFAQSLNYYMSAVLDLPPNPVTPIAWARVGDCQFQLGSVDPTRYPLAIAAYRRVIESGAAVAIRSQAEVALANVLRQQARMVQGEQAVKYLQQALEEVLGVLYGRNLKEREQPDPYWQARAGLLALEIAIELRDQETARELGSAIKSRFPALQPKVDALLVKLGGSSTHNDRIQ